jgi:hypothetical protein
VIAAISFRVRESEAPPQWVIIKWIGGEISRVEIFVI